VSCVPDGGAGIGITQKWCVLRDLRRKTFLTGGGCVGEEKHPNHFCPLGIRAAFSQGGKRILAPSHEKGGPHKGLRKIER